MVNRNCNDNDDIERQRFKYEILRWNFLIEKCIDVKDTIIVPVQKEYPSE